MVTKSEERSDRHSGEALYDAFLSYAHEADELLAPRLQVALQRFAKPWWKRRALRIFRDESSLGANPHLWSSITDALDASNWFVLLLSPRAATSEWVGQEIAYWVEHRPPARILPVVTDGDFSWEDGDVVGSAVPPALRGVLHEEPRWVDLRFARHDEQLDLKNPRFSAAVADLASAIHGVAKDELESEEVRQHRRTKQTAWAAGVVLLVLAVATAVAALFALSQRNEARQLAASEAEARLLADANADEAATSAAQAAASAEEAAASAATADANAAEADRNAALARARELAASAVAVRSSDPELSILLSLAAAASADPPPEAVRSLHEAVQSSRTVSTVDEDFLATDRFVAYALGERLVATLMADHTVSIRPISAEGEFLPETSRFPFPEPMGSRQAVALSPDGALVAVAFSVEDSDGGPAGRLTLWNALTGELVAEHPLPGQFTTQVEFDVDGDELLVVSANRLTSTLFPQLYDLSRDRLLDPVPVQLSNDVRFIPGTHRALHHTFNEGVVSIIDFDTATVTGLFTHGATVIGARMSPDGDLVAIASRNGPIYLYDAQTGNVLERLNESGPEAGVLVFTEDGRSLLTGDSQGTIRIYDVGTGRLTQSLNGHTSGIRASAWLDGNTRVVTSALHGSLRVWDVGSEALGEVVSYDLSDTEIVRHMEVVGGHAFVATRRLDQTPGSLEVVDLTSGAVEFSYPEVWGRGVGVSPSGSHVAVMLGSAPEGDPAEGLEMATGLVRVVDMASGEVDVVLDPLCGSEIASRDGDIVATCENPRARPYNKPTVGLTYSPDGSKIAVAGGAVTISDATTGELLAATRLGGSNQVAGFVNDGELLVVDHTDRNRLVLLGADDLSTVHAFDLPAPAGNIASISPDERLIAVPVGATVLVIDWESGTVRAVTGHSGDVIDIDFSPDGARIASIDAAGEVIIWDSASFDELERVPYVGPRANRMQFVDSGTLVVGDVGANLALIALDRELVAEAARSRLTRGFTVEECNRYFADEACTPGQRP